MKPITKDDVKALERRLNALSHRFANCKELAETLIALNEKWAADGSHWRGERSDVRAELVTAKKLVAKTLRQTRPRTVDLVIASVLLPRCTTACDRCPRTNRDSGRGQFVCQAQAVLSERAKATQKSSFTVALDKRGNLVRG